MLVKNISAQNLCSILNFNRQLLFHVGENKYFLLNIENGE